MSTIPSHLLNSKTHLGSISQSESGLSFKVCNGEEARAYWREIAAMRIEMFKEFPYLYEGNFEDEKTYLNATFSSKKCHVLLVFDHDTLIGFSTANSLDNEIEQIQRPFVQKALNTQEYYYIAEVVIKADYRSMSLLRRISEFNENCATREGYSQIIFMTIKRSKTHPLCPSGYRDLDPIWRRFGYRLMEGMDIHITWMMIDTHQKEDNPLELWAKTI